MIDRNALQSVTYMEPYAVGAGAGLALLLLGKVDRVIINDYDVAVYAFWVSVLDDTDAFIRRIRDIPVTIDE